MTVGIVGSGPAGSLAAVLLAQRGVTVSLFDEQAETGGHLIYDDYPLADDVLASSWKLEIDQALKSSNVDHRCSTVVWAAYQRDGVHELALNHQGTQDTFTCEHAIIATGTTDRPLIRPGVTLPGVLTSRAIRILTRRHGVAPGQRCAIIGENAEAARLADDLTALGLEVQGVIPEAEVASIEGTTTVESVVTCDGTVIAVDCVVVAAGEAADFQLASILGLKSTFSPESRSWTVESASGPGNLFVIGGARSGALGFRTVLESAVTCAAKLTGASITPGDISSVLPVTSLVLERARS